MIIILDITRNSKIISSLFIENLKFISRNCFVPICAGGKIKNIKDVDLYLKSGADKISINSEAFVNPGIVKKLLKFMGLSLTLSLM